jgi:hypothetical protein
VIVAEGIERYADVGWVGPEFFAIKSPASPHGYELTPLSDGRARFTARFRSPRSEGEALELFRGEERGAEPVLFCNIPATLKKLQRTGIKRLAVWPTNGISASMSLHSDHELTLDLRDWQSAQEVTVSFVLDRSDTDLLQKELRGPIGAWIDFHVYNQWRRSGCIQQVDLYGIDAIGLRDGETGAVPLAEIKRAVRQVLAASTKVDITGACGPYSIAVPATPQDNGLFISCRRTGNSLECRYEGEFQTLPAVYSIRAKIGEHVGGVF